MNKIISLLPILLIVVISGCIGQPPTTTTTTTITTTTTTTIQTTTTTPTTTTTLQAKTVEVSITSSGFSPSTVTINAGDTVEFVNMDSASHWPASNTHPIHNCYPGFDSNPGIGPGGSYSFTFNIVKTCGFHDHLNPSVGGTIIVQ